MTDGTLTLDRQFLMTVLTGYRKGLVLTAAGTLFASFEGLLVRLVSAESWTVIAWRGFLLGLVMLAFIGLVGKKLHVRDLGRAGWIAVASYACNICFFISAINATTVANTLVIASAAPLFAAAIGWTFLRERPDKATSIAVVVVLFGLAIIFSGSLSTSRMAGDFLALGYAVSLAAYCVALQRCPEMHVPSIVAVGGFLSGLVAWPFAGGLSVAAVDLPPLLALGIVVVPAATLLLSMGPQFMPGSHVTLIMMLEILLGPLWVWMMFREMPSATTALGGALVLATILAHSWFTAFRGSRQPVATPVQSSLLGNNSED
jgi:drug/metabolite transporter (DMT)-like permease